MHKIVNLESYINYTGEFGFKGINTEGEQIDIILSEAVFENLFLTMWEKRAQEENQLDQLKKMRRRLYAKLKGKLDPEERENTYQSYLTITDIVKKMEEK